MTDKSHTGTMGESVNSAKPPISFSGTQQQHLIAMNESNSRMALRLDVIRALDLREGERVLELGSGPGNLARSIAQLVGPKGRVMGIDINPELVEISGEKCNDIPWAEIREGNLLELQFDDREFDVVTACSVLQYVADLETAYSEIFRVLRPLGRVLVLDTEWDSAVWYSKDRVRMRRILDAWRELLASPEICQTLAPMLRRAGFVLQRRELITSFKPELQQTAGGLSGINMTAEAVVGINGITEGEAQDWAAEQIELANEGAYFSSLSRLLVVAMKP